MVKPQITAMKKSLVLAVLALAVALVGLALWITLGFGDDKQKAIGGAGATIEAPLVQDEALSEPSPVEAPAAAGSGLQERTSAAPLVVEASSNDPWAAELGGLIGRVVEEDGTPVPEISVSLAQVDATMMLGADWAEMGEAAPKLILETTETDVEGRFQLSGSYDASFQGIGVDLRGPRATLRVVDTQLHHREVTDIGDIVLLRGCTVIGRVVDEAAEPVAGVRVRLAPTPNEDLDDFLKVGVQDFRADCAIGVTSMIDSGAGSPVFEPPPLVKQHIDDLPIPTTYTDADGRFRIEGIAIGKILYGIDKRGWLGMTRVETTEPGEVVLEDAVLRAGRTVSGTVVDGEGEPIEGVEVLAGTEFVFGEAGMLHPAGITGSDGRFSVAGCPLEGGLMACARRSRDEPWVGALAAGGEDLEIELESTFRMIVRVIDLAGEPVRAARVNVAPGFEEQNAMGMLTRFQNLGAVEPLAVRFRETDPGTYVCDDLTPGQYEVTARAPGLAPVRKTLDLWDGEAELTLTCEGGRKVAVTVRDAVTSQPVRAARASVVSLGGAGFIGSLGVGRSDANGKVELGPFQVDTEEQGGFFGGSRGQHILVQHPRYADASMELTDGMEVAEVALRPGGEIRGQVRWGSDPPQNVYMLVLESRGESSRGMMQAFLPPRLGRTSLDGSFRFSNLAPGTYQVSVFDRFFDRDPVALMMAQKEPTLVHKEKDVQLEMGQDLELLIDLSPSGRGQTARVAGTITLDGRPLEDAEVRISGSGPRVTAKTDASGYYESADFLVSEQVWVRVTGDVARPDGESSRRQLLAETIEPVPHSVYQLDVVLRTREVHAKVRAAADGQPLADARVNMRQGRGSSERVNTDAQGEAVLVAVAGGKHTFSASRDGYAKAEVTVDLDDDGFDGNVVLELSAPTPCAGLCDMTGLAYSNFNNAHLNVEGEGHNEWTRLDREDVHDDGRATFQLSNLKPGSYKARIWGGRSMSAAVTFELPEAGDENLLLVFAKQQ